MASFNRKRWVFILPILAALGDARRENYTVIVEAHELFGGERGLSKSLVPNSNRMNMVQGDPSVWG